MGISHHMPNNYPKGKLNSVLILKSVLPYWIQIEACLNQDLPHRALSRSVRSQRIGSPTLVGGPIHQFPGTISAPKQGL
ncbi:hypothetical protein TNIN_289071 [Trichonephila inaurata madagascariensis]|uniref:Uncharacterized protein n=1 Tax=Trichonephila inaurata madagascariensis TaxID=2747483 RepID=A0A8X6K4K4_9ARAC|nr:hypothetical protein TNIN_289051 [Trichonephila inaurata madagascariensis]GFS65672.1 hypothetical protein TNIN_289071 [Trichonephila inaurata madagascariensis]